MQSGLEIPYPCLWNYRIIGTEEEAMRALVADVAGDDSYRLVRSNRSHSGKYVALLLTLVVRDEEHRLGVFRHLADAETIRYVL